MFARTFQIFSSAKIFFLLLAGFFPFQTFALGQIQYVENAPAKNSFQLVQKKAAAEIFADTNDFAGVLIAANNLRTDIQKVSGVMPEISSDEKNLSTNAILIGTIGHSEIIDRLIRERKIDVSEISNRWESYFLQTVSKPFPGVERALVICGSDKRGTIYGIYDLSEEIGISPWYFFADVPAKHHDEFFVRAGKFSQGPPAVKYRGIFINDEAPDLTGWVKARYGNYNHNFYTNIFELLLRLKANYLWPAMWDNAFNEDDSLNPQLADEYGIVMGTSHVEPMMRADKEWDRAGFTAREWNFQTHSNDLKSFWREGLERNKNYENIITIAMRGKIDTPMSPTANISLLENIVTAQRKIISEVYHTNAESVPQLWALYKEVQEYYEKGMRVPDDVTLLWCDDNWGDIRRLPTPAERKRVGGAGIYYHLDYVGDPRNYKWVNSVQIPRVWEQMNLAYNYGANEIWIANVGHVMHVQFPTEFFLTFAWNPNRWPKEKISEFTELWAQREFGKEFAPQIADVISKFTKYNARRKPELLSPETFSVVNYQEADRVLADWKKITAQAEDIYQKLPADERDAFFEMVLYPTKACEIVNELYIDAAKNRLYAAQGRASANDFANDVKKLFQADADLSAYYNHDLSGGKWNHMMDQTHIGYTRWQQPESNSPPKIIELKISDEAKMGIATEGSTNSWPDFSGEAILPTFDKFNQPKFYIEVFNQGNLPFDFSAQPGAMSILLSATNGTIEKEKRIWVSVDWKKVGQASSLSNSENSFVKISNGTNSVFVKVNLFNPKKPSRKSVKGFVEADGYVSIEAEDFSKNVSAKNARWEKIPNLGRTDSAMSIFPVTAESVLPPKNSPCLEYKMFLFDAGKIQVEIILSPTLNFMPGHAQRFAISFDDAPPQIVTAVPENFLKGSGGGSRDWAKMVSDSAREIKTDFTLAREGGHTLKIWMVDPGVVLQKIVVNCGGEKPSYLGPPESFNRE